MITSVEALRDRLGELPEGRCLAGFSGGADSTAMILLLAAERDAGRIRPEAVHVNHGLRLEESDEDEEFCRTLCSRLGIPFHAEQAVLEGKQDENACREARFRCFRRVMKETGIRDLVLAHNLDDLAETFMMRLIRGAGTEGLACMTGRDNRQEYTIYRPLLRISRHEIRDILQQNRIPWREDSLNLSDAYLRNRIRRQLIPLMNEMNAGSTRRIASAAEIIANDNLVLQNLAEEFLEAHADRWMLDSEALAEQPEALRARILRSWWKQNAPDLEEHTLSARQTAELASLAGAERGKVNLPGGRFAEKGRKRIYLTGFPMKIPEAVPFEAGISGTVAFGTCLMTTGPSAGTPGNGITEQEVPEGFFSGCEIRTRREGDRIRPYGMKGSRKLQDYLTDRGVDKPLRDLIPLICRGNEVLLAAGIGAGAVPEWSAEVKNIRVRWTGSMPWITEERKETESGTDI